MGLRRKVVEVRRFANSKTGGRLARGTALAAVGLLLAAGASWPGEAAARQPTCDEYALLAYANHARSQQGLTPMIWNEGLGAAARYHSDDVVAHGCFQHNSCNGQAWYLRIQSYYPGWILLAENISGIGSNPRIAHEGWMASEGHRANILGNYTEFGSGIAVAPPSEGSWSFATEDFGNRGAIALGSLPTLPAGAVVPRLHYATQPRDLFVNYYHHGGGAPKAVRALVGSSCVNLTRIAGSASNGTYGTTRSFSDTCTPVVFEAIRSDGTRHRWPADKAIVVGVGSASANCPQFTNDVPTQDCGGGGGPLPTPTPAPPEGSDLDDVRVVVKPGTAGAQKGTVQVQATLPSLGDFDPTSEGVTIDLDFPGSGQWGMDLPSTCDGEPCLAPNRRSTAYNGKYDGDAKLTFVRGSNGLWKMRFSARKQAVDDLQPGPVTVTVSVDGRALTATIDGELLQRTIVAR